jgi:hypothetical protein
MITSPEQVLRECINDYCDIATGDVETLKQYGPGLAHIVADMMETAG